jgi:hypothetical protein
MVISRSWAPAVDGLRPCNVTASIATHGGRRAVRLVETELGPGGLATLPGTDLGDGVIEAEVAATVRPDAAPEMRGFVGIAFGVQADGTRYECFFLRPTNARADDQLRRNHSTQYMAHPDRPWFRLRAASPGVYESYTDLVPGAWTSLRIELAGSRARLAVNGAAQPCLIVNDRTPAGPGAVALWIGAGSEAWFSAVTVTGGDPIAATP